MPIPDFDLNGFLPPGIYDCTLTEVEQRFARFQVTAKRIQLFDKLREYATKALATGKLDSIIVDGSFVTSKPEPNDIDLITVLDVNYVLGQQIP